VSEFADGALRPKEAARFLGVSKVYLYDLMSRGELVWSTRPGMRLISVRSLVAWLESGRVSK
jgi:excisionase family DNA binding protein